jgi:hypothetical protein
MAVSTRKRFEVFKRDAFTCQYCGRKPPDVVLHVDHVIAQAAGGKDGMENLATSCSTCNLGKNAVPLTRIPAAPAFPSDIAEHRKQLKAYMEWQQEIRAFEEEQLALVVAHWEEAGYALYPSQRDSLPFMLKKLGAEKVIFAMEQAIRRNRPWKYACAIMWNLLDPLRQFPEWFVVCTKECQAGHKGIAWARRKTREDACEGFASQHENVPVVSWHVFRVAPNTGMDENGAWVLPKHCPATPILIETCVPAAKRRAKSRG